jgi:CRP-like cAMP-binding protein
MSPDELVERIVGAPVFAGIAGEELLPLPPGVRIRTHERGQLVSQPGVVPAALRILLKGRLCLYEVTPEGRRLVLEYMEPGDVDGMLELAGLGRSFSVADTCCDIASITAESLTRLIQRIPELGPNLFTLAIQKLNLRQAQLQWLCLRDPSQRLASQLLTMADRHSDQKDEVAWAPRISHEGLADMLALRRETVTLHLGRLRRQGLVTVEGDRFVLDLPGLNSIVDGYASSGAATRRPRPSEESGAAAGCLSAVAGC